MSIRKTLFISDLHLDENTPDITQQFYEFLTLCDSSVDALYILGDLFEAWIGDDATTAFNLKIIDALKTVSQRNIKIYFQHGNRDFFIGKKFAKTTQCQLLPDYFPINLYGSKVLLMHGDLLCTRDSNYLRARKIAHITFLQKLFLLLPIHIRQKIADKLRGKSDIHKKTISMEIMDVTQQAVIDTMKTYSVNYLIHGHTHKPAIHNFIIDNESCQRIVLPAWHGRGGFLSWDNTGKYELINL